jgi:hypothetical protein
MSKTKIYYCHSIAMQTSLSDFHHGWPKAGWEDIKALILLEDLEKEQQLSAKLIEVLKLAHPPHPIAPKCFACEAIEAYESAQKENK